MQGPPYRRGAAVLGMSALLCLWPGELRAQIRLEDPERNMSLAITGWIQPRYEFLDRSPGEDLSSVFLRRVRLDLQGHVFTERLTYRILPELARTASLRDGWLDYAFSPRLRLRFGQFTVPFQWHRFVSPRRQHFAERGAPSETFGFPAGRDLGIMIHGRNAAGTAGWNAGIFDGAGRNVERSNSAGNMGSGRLSLALLGTLPREEVDIIPSPEPRLSVGLGLQGATENEARAWDLGRSGVGDPRADWLSGTIDGHFRWQGLSIAADGYLRRVWPDDSLVEPYTGAAYMITGGYTLVAGHLDAVARWSSLRLDRDDPGTEHRHWGLGINIYHFGHDSKTRVQFLNDRVRNDGDGPLRTGLFLIEFHVQF